MGLRWVRKRDGRRVGFDVKKLATAIRDASREAGETILAEEIAEVVALFLEKQCADLQAQGRDILSTEDIQDVVERVLLETNHPLTAARFAERHREKGRRRQGLRVRRGTLAPSTPDGEPLAPPAPDPWNKGSIATRLQRWCGLEPPIAEEVAAEVEERVLALELEQVSSTLVREVVNAVLARRGFAARLAEPEWIAIRADEIRHRLVTAYVRRSNEPTPPGGLEAMLGVHLLGEWALEHVYPERVSAAHREGEIHIQDLGRPLRLSTGAVALDWLKRALGSDAPRSAAELMNGLATLLARASSLHARTIGVPYANVFLAPFACRREATVRRDLIEGLRILAASCVANGVVLHLGSVPPVLRNRSPVGFGAKRWKNGYGSLEAQARLVTEIVLSSIEQVRARLSNPRLQLVLEFDESLPTALAEAADALTLALPHGRLPASRGLCDAQALAQPPRQPPFAAGATEAVGINCARAALLAGPGAEPELRQRLLALTDLAYEAMLTHRKLLETTLYKPDLPLWRREQPAEPPCAVDLERSQCVLALCGLDEAMLALTGERIGDNPAVAECAAELVLAIKQRLRELQATHGLDVVIEQPNMPASGQRLADLDLQRYGDAARRLFADQAKGQPRYDTRIAPASTNPDVAGRFERELYAPLGLQPWFEGPEKIAQARAWLQIDTNCTSPAKA